MKKAKTKNSTHRDANVRKRIEIRGDEPVPRPSLVQRLEQRQGTGGHEPRVPIARASDPPIRHRLDGETE